MTDHPNRVLFSSSKASQATAQWREALASPTSSPLRTTPSNGSDELEDAYESSGKRHHKNVSDSRSRLRLDTQTVHTPAERGILKDSTKSLRFQHLRSPQLTSNASGSFRWRDFDSPMTSFSHSRSMTSTKKRNSTPVRDATHIVVGIRSRPLNELERSMNEDEVWEYIAPNQITDRLRKGQPFPKQYEFDHVFGPNASTSTVYESMGVPIVDAVMDGYNGSIFAYGQTSSGKTYTLMGSPEEPGMTVLAVHDVFRAIEEASPTRHYEVRVSYLEIYNEEIKDLFQPNSGNLKIVDQPIIGPQIKGLTEEVVTSPARVMEMLDIGENNRSIASTNMNARSSRSHAVFRLIVESWDSNAVYSATTPLPSAKSSFEGFDAESIDTEDIEALSLPRDRFRGKKIKHDRSVRVSCLNLVDLAGSERVSKTKPIGKQLVESGRINASLLTLGTVISKLVSGSDHIPYRDSKLTRLLSTSLGGNARTAIICTMSPAGWNHGETHSTLLFANRARKVVNRAHVNEISDKAALLHRYRAEIAELKSALLEARGGQFVTADGETVSAEELVDRIRQLQDHKLQKMVDKLTHEQKMRRNAEQISDQLRRFVYIAAHAAGSLQHAPRVVALLAATGCGKIAAISAGEHIIDSIPGFRQQMSRRLKSLNASGSSATSAVSPNSAESAIGSSPRRIMTESNEIDVQHDDKLLKIADLDDIPPEEVLAFEHDLKDALYKMNEAGYLDDIEWEKFSPRSFAAHLNKLCIFALQQHEEAQQERSRVDQLLNEMDNLRQEAVDIKIEETRMSPTSKNKFVALREQVQALTEELRETRRQKESSDTQLERVQIQRDDLFDQLSTLKDQSSAISADLAQELAETLGKLRAAERKASEAYVMKETYERRCNEQQELITELECSLKETRESNTELTNEIEALTAANEAAEYRAESIEKRLAETREYVDELREAQSEDRRVCSQLRAQKSQLETQVSNLKRSLSDNEQSYAMKEAQETHRLQMVQQEMQDALVRANQQEKDLRETIRSLEQQVQESHDAFQKAKLDIETSENSYHTVQLDLQKSQTDYVQLEREYSSLTEELENVTRTKDKLQSSFKETVTELETEMKLLVENFEECEVELRQERSMHQILKEQYQTMSQENKTLEQNILEYQETLSQLEKEFTDVTTKLQETRELLNTSKSQTELLNEKNEQLALRLNSAHEQMDKMSNELLSSTDTVEQHHTERKALLEKLREFEQNADTMKENNTMLTQELERLQETIRLSEQNWNARRNSDHREARWRVQSLFNGIVQLREQFDTFKHEILEQFGNVSKSSTKTLDSSHIMYLPNELFTNVKQWSIIQSQTNQIQLERLQEVLRGLEEAVSLRFDGLIKGANQSPSSPLSAHHLAAIQKSTTDNIHSKYFSKESSIELHHIQDAAPILKNLLECSTEPISVTHPLILDMASKMTHQFETLHESFVSNQETTRSPLKTTSTEQTSSLNSGLVDEWSQMDNTPSTHKSPFKLSPSPVPNHLMASWQNSVNDDGNSLTSEVSSPFYHSVDETTMRLRQTIYQLTHKTNIQRDLIEQRTREVEHLRRMILTVRDVNIHLREQLARAHQQMYGEQLNELREKYDTLDIELNQCIRDESNNLDRNDSPMTFKNSSSNQVQFESKLQSNSDIHNQNGIETPRTNYIHSPKHFTSSSASSISVRRHVSFHDLTLPTSTIHSPADTTKMQSTIQSTAATTKPTSTMHSTAATSRFSTKLPSTTATTKSPRYISPASKARAQVRLSQTYQPLRKRSVLNSHIENASPPTGQKLSMSAPVRRNKARVHFDPESPKRLVKGLEHIRKALGSYMQQDSADSI